jgi:hypothetical protein
MKTSATFLLAAGIALASLTVLAADKATGKDKDKKSDAKPYLLTTCIVSGEKLDKDAYVFVYQGRQIKACCDSCEGDFKKEPAKFIKKIETEEAKLKK